MAGQLGFWSLEERLVKISAQGDPLETLPPGLCKTRVH